MGIYRDTASGLVVEVPDHIAAARSEYVPLSPTEEADLDRAAVQQIRADARGFEGTFNAGGTRFFSGLTLGASDVALGELMSEEARQQLAADIEAHPIASVIGEVGGAVTGAIAAPGSILAKTPAGYLSSFAAREAEAGLVRGGVGGTARALNAFGVEGALQSAGSYIGQTAIRDTEVTAEGLGASLGLGYAFGAGAGGVLIGVEKGTIAAKRLFSKAMDGGEEAVAKATTEWETASKQFLDASEENLRVAQQQLDAIRLAKAEAQAARARASSVLREEQARAVRVGPEEAAAAARSGEAMRATSAAADQEAILRGFAPEGEIAPIGLAEDLAPPPAPRAAEMPEIPASLADNGHAAPVGLSDDATRNLGIRPEFTTPAFKSADTVNLNIRPAPVDEGSAFATLGRGAGGDHVAPLGVPAEDAFSAMGRQAGGRHAVPAYKGRSPIGSAAGPAGDVPQEILKQEAKLAEAVEEFVAAQKTFNGAVIEDLNKFTNMDTDAFMEFVERGGSDINEFLRMQPEAMDLDLGPAMLEPYAPAWSEDDLLRQFAAEGDPVALRRLGLQQEQKRLNAPASTKTGTAVGHIRAKPVESIAQEAEAIQRLEEASAKLADVLGDNAHPGSRAAADEYRAASDDAVRKMRERSTRAAEDHETFGPKPMSAKERVAYAKERKLEADSGYETARAPEPEAKQRFQEAKRAAKTAQGDYKAATKAAKAETKASGSGGVGATALDSAAAVELIGGIPGLHDLPVIGPLASAYLKFRAVKSLIGKGFGRVPATGNTKAAALAAHTKERIAVATEQILARTTKSARAAQKYTPQAFGVLAARIYDDGQPDAPKGAGIQEMAAVRMREIAAYVANPGAIERDVRRELQGVTDPDLIAAAEAHRRAMFQYLYDNMPKQPPPNPLARIEWRPSPSAALKFARQLEVANDPVSAFEGAANGTLTLEGAKTLRETYPNLFGLGQQHAMRVAIKLKTKVPYAMRTQMSMLWDAPLDASLEPDNIRLLQSAFAPVAPEPPAGAPVPPTPSIAQPITITPLFQTATDRSASKR